MFGKTKKQKITPAAGFYLPPPTRKKFRVMYELLKDAEKYDDGGNCKARNGVLHVLVEHIELFIAEESKDKQTEKSNIVEKKNIAMTKKRVYIAGKVTGEPKHTCALKFAMAQKEIESLGFEVVNPLEVVRDPKCDWDVAMKKCIKELVGCHIMVILPDWKESKGATIERKLAEDLGMPIFNFSKIGLKAMTINQM